MEKKFLTITDYSDKVNGEIKRNKISKQQSIIFYLQKIFKVFHKKGVERFILNPLIRSLSMESRYHPFTTPRRIDKMQVPRWRPSCHRHWLPRQLRSLPDRTDVPFIDCSIWTQMALRITAPRIRSGIGAQRVFSSSSSFENISFRH